MLIRNNFNNYLQNKQNDRLAFRQNKANLSPQISEYTSFKGNDNYSNNLKSLYKNSVSALISFKGSVEKFVDQFKPRVAVVDVADNSPRIDINGDFEPDLSHREFVKTILNNTCPVEMVDFTVPEGEDIQVYCKDLKNTFDQIYEKMQEKQEHFDAVNVSYYIFTSYKGTISNGTEISPENISKYRSDLRKIIKESSEPSDVLLNSALESIEKVAKKVPVFIAAGNDPDGFNLLNLAENTITVGGVNAKGEIMDYLSDNTLVKDRAQGIYNITKVFSDKDKTKITGFDVTGSGNVEISVDKVLYKEPYVERFVGKNINNLLPTKEDFDLLEDSVKEKQLSNQDLNRLSKLLFPLNKLLEKNIIEKDFYNRHIKKGTFIPITVIFIPVTIKNDPDNGVNVYYFSENIVFTTNDKGEVIYDPDGSGRKDAVTTAYGNSFSAPRAVGLYLKKMMQEKFQKTA